jgi:hypothetical protein
VEEEPGRKLSRERQTLKERNRKGRKEKSIEFDLGSAFAII